MNRWSIYSLIAAMLIPQSINNYVVRSATGLSLKISKSAPPLAIFEDEKLKILDEDNSLNIPLGIPIQLAAGKYTLETLINKIQIPLEQEEVKESVQAVQITQEINDSRVVQLKGIKLEKSNPNVKNLIPQKPTSQNEQVPAEKFIPDATKTVDQQFEEIKSHYLNKELFAELSPAQRIRLENVDNLNEVVNRDYS